MQIDSLFRQILQRTQVVKKPVELAVHAAAQRIWPGTDGEVVVVAGFTKGTLHLVFDSQARMSEASAFHNEALRSAINEELEKQYPKPDGRRQNDGLSPQSSRDGLYVTRLRFHATGTY